MRIVSGGVTDVGRVRSNNEDCFRIVEPLSLYVLSDGMGGEAHGEVASAMAVDTIVNYCSNPIRDPNDTAVIASQTGWSDKTRLLTKSVHRANKSIYEAAEANAEQHGMGATVTAAWIDGSKLSVAHVGDSRAYLLRAGSLQQLTSDHSLVAEQVRRGILTPAEAEQSEMQSVLLRALGAVPEIEVDTEEYVIFARDILMLCCDGLTRMVTEPEIAGTLQAETDPTRAAEKLIALANERGGVDNITVIVARIGAESRGWFSWLWGGGRKKAAGNGTSGGR